MDNYLLFSQGLWWLIVSNYNMLNDKILGL